MNITSKFNENELRSLYDELVIMTDNFTDINPHILIMSPERLTGLRLMCSLSHSQLAEAYLIKYGKKNYFNAYEEKPVRMSIDTASKIASVLSEYLPKKPSLEILINNYNNMQKYSNNHIIGSNLEQHLILILDSNQIPFVRHPMISSFSDVKHRLDFVIPNILNPKIAIECKVSKSFGSQGSLKDAKILAFTTIDLKEKVPVIALIDGEHWCESAMKILRKYCNFYTIKQVDKLLQNIKETMNTSLTKNSKNGEEIF